MLINVMLIKNMQLTFVKVYLCEVKAQGKQEIKLGNWLIMQLTVLRYCTNWYYLSLNNSFFIFIFLHSVVNDSPPLQHLRK